MNTKDALLAEIAKSREAIRRDYSGVREEMRLQNHVRSWVRGNPWAWVGGASLLGFVLSGPKTKTKVVTKRAKSRKGKSEAAEATKPLGFAAIVLGLLRFAFPLVRPLLMSYAARRFGVLADQVGR
ncbi:MAG: hypothetical protein SFU53_07720 [Terrimicrobiaceae bacterium]|nr:hypothetical protein [Terrimicrobiaceae bacterium]